MEVLKNRLIALVLLRLAIGWHFLYEGLAKVFNPSWSSKTYLLDSGGMLKGFFEWMTHNQSVLKTVDFLNAWGLSLIGLSLILGLFSRYAARAGMILLSLYYLSHPAIHGISYLFPSDGSYFLVNKTIIEILALYVLSTWSTDDFIGVGRFFRKSDYND
ncbi:MAG: DoxX family membrane protein [Bacteroidales bacterium]